MNGEPEPHRSYNACFISCFFFRDGIVLYIDIAWAGWYSVVHLKEEDLIPRTHLQVSYSVL
jgi:hypothetical protein